MQTVIVYATKYGCTKKCAEMLQASLGGDVTLINLQQTTAISWEDYDCVVIGGAIYAGKLHDAVTKFYQNNMEILLTKKLGLFFCGASVEKAEEQAKAAFSKRLRDHATAIEYLGHEFRFENMDLLTKLIIRLVVKKSKSESHISTDHIERLARAIRAS